MSTTTTNAARVNAAEIAHATAVGIVNSSYGKAVIKKFRAAKIVYLCSEAGWGAPVGNGPMTFTARAEGVAGPVLGRVTKAEARMLADRAKCTLIDQT